jgi:hypothetical protein
VQSVPDPDERDQRRSALRREGAAVGLEVVLRALGLPGDVPGLGGLAVSGFDLLAARLRDEARPRLHLFARTLSAAAGQTFEDAAQRLADVPDGTTNLYAALDRLISAPGRERAILLGAILGERVRDDTEIEQDVWQTLLALATSLGASDVRLLRAIESLPESAAGRGDAGVSRDQIVEAIPPLAPILGGLLAAGTAIGTIGASTYEGNGLSYGGSRQVNRWLLTDLGREVLGYLSRYTVSE